MRTDCAAYVAIELSVRARGRDSKFFVVVCAGTAEVGRTTERSVKGSLVHWNELNIAM
jgi:hypothetical protein